MPLLILSTKYGRDDDESFYENNPWILRLYQQNSRVQARLDKAAADEARRLGPKRIITNREMIWQRAFRHMSSSHRRGELDEIREEATRDGFSLLKKEFRGYAFQDSWEGLELGKGAGKAAAPVTYKRKNKQAKKELIDRQVDSILTRNADGRHAAKGKSRRMGVIAR